MAGVTNPQDSAGIAVEFDAVSIVFGDKPRFR